MYLRMLRLVVGRFGEVTHELVHESVTRFRIQVDVVAMVCHRNVQYRKCSWVTMVVKRRRESLIIPFRRPHFVSTHFPLEGRFASPTAWPQTGASSTAAGSRVADAAVPPAVDSKFHNLRYVFLMFKLRHAMIRPDVPD
jgi:hypothetical protein